MERYCSTGQSPQRAVASMEEEKEEEEFEIYRRLFYNEMLAKTNYL
jgi:hypothetical protein